MRNSFFAPLHTAAALLGVFVVTPLCAQTAPTTAAAQPQSATAPTTATAPTVPAGAQAAKPDWRQLDRYQGQLSKTDFVGQLNTIFAPHGASAQTILVGNFGANILTEANTPRKSYYLLTFAPEASVQGAVRDSAGRLVTHTAPTSPQASKATGSHAETPYWKSAEQVRKAGTPSKPLAGLNVALDPGHIGGQWAFMEQREWSFGGGPVFREGDFVLRVAELLAADLRELGATVTLVRDSNEPLTDSRPADFVELARQRLKERNGTEPTEQLVRRESELMFYRIAEIRARAEKVDNEIQPDVVVCLHVDGTSFPPAGATALPHGGTLHVLVNGAYSADELAFDDQRLAMLERMLSGASTEEIALADAVASQLAADTGLPPMTYTGSNAVRVNDNPFVWGRNLIANRLYDAPTVFIEAYTANREPFYQRFAYGEYNGVQIINGTPYKNIYREYSDSVRDALLKHYAPQQ